MSKQNVDIPIIGMDRRLSQRQSMPGLCSSITNLEPTGNERRPYWKRAKSLDNLPLTHNQPAHLLNHAAWHTRSVVGKFNVDSVSLKRLVCFYSNGAVRVYDPALDYQVTASIDLPGSGYTYTTSNINNGMAFTANNDEGSGIYLIVDDKIVLFELPPAPLIIPFAESKELIPIWDIDLGALPEEAMAYSLGLYDSLEAGGIYVAYAIRLHDGSLVRMSGIQFIQLPAKFIDTDEKTSGRFKWTSEISTLTYSLKFYHDGYSQIGLPEDIEFWESQVEGIVLLAGGHRFQEKIEDDPYKYEDDLNSQPSDLEDILFYEVGSFPFLDNTDKSVDECTVEFACKAEEISAYPLAQIQAINNRITGDCIASYNSRMVIGASQEDFPQPHLPNYSTGSDIVAVPTYVDGDLVVHLMGGTHDTYSFYNVSILGSSGLTNVQSNRHLHHRIDRITADISVYPWTLKLKVGHVTIDMTGVRAQDPTTTYSINYSNSLTAAIDIETSHSTFQRVWLAPKDVVRDSRWVTEIGDRRRLRNDYMFFNNRAFFYPDRRAKTLYLYEGDTLVSVQKLRQSNTQNIAFALEQLSADTAATGKPSLQVNTKLNAIPNRVHVSEVNAPFSYLANRVYYVGEATNSRITAIASNSLAVSEGQFGHYPLYIFCSDSIWALEQGRSLDVVFQSISPISLSHGVANHLQLTNLGRQIAFVYSDGIFLLAGNRIVEIGQPIANHPNQPSIDYKQAVIASRQRGGDDELFVSIPSESIVYVYNLRFRQWYSLSRVRHRWFSNEGSLYGVSGNLIYSYDQPTQQPVPWSIEFRPIHFNMPDQFKRLHACHLRGNISSVSMGINTDKGDSVTTNNTYKRIRVKSAYKYSVDVSGQFSSDDHYIEAISAEVEARYPHKTRVAP